MSLGFFYWLNHVFAFCKDLVFQCTPLPPSRPPERKREAHCVARVLAGWEDPTTSFGFRPYGPDYSLSKWPFAWIVGCPFIVHGFSLDP